MPLGGFLSHPGLEPGIPAGSGNSIVKFRTNQAREQVVNCLIEGCSIRATVRMTGVAKKTVMRLLVEGDLQQSRMSAITSILPLFFAGE